MSKLKCYDCDTAFDTDKLFEAHCHKVHVVEFKRAIAQFCTDNDPVSRTMAEISDLFDNFDAHCVVKAIILAMAKDCDVMFTEELKHSILTLPNKTPYEWYLYVCPDDLVDPDMFDSDDLDSDDSLEVFRHAEVKVLSSRVIQLRALANSCWTIASVVAAVLHYKTHAEDWITRCVINHMYYLN